MEGLQLVSVGDDQPDRAEAFYRKLEAAIIADPDNPLTIDLSLISFLSTDGLMQLITAARLWQRKTGQPAIFAGMKPEVHKYLERMDVFDVCGDCILEAHPLDPGERWSRSQASQKLLEVMPLSAEAIENSYDVTKAVGRAQRILDTWFGADPTTSSPIATILSEIASNVTHSCDRGFAIIQHHHRQTAGRVTIAVGDLGIGIEASLRRQGARLGHFHQGAPPVGSGAILRALELGVTSRGDVRGMGLYQVKTLVDRWQGILAIRSGRSSVRIAESQIYVRDGLVDVPGTQVTIIVRGVAENIVPF